MKLLKPGDKAAIFYLVDQDEVLIDSNSFLGKRILIYFYPKAMTIGCTIQACKLRDHIHKFKSLDMEIIGISIDNQKNY